MKRGTVALALAILDIAGYAALSVLALGLLGPGQDDPVSALLGAAAVAVFALMGALLIHRVPANPIGTLLLATGTVQAAGLGLQIYGSLGGSASPEWPGAAVVAAMTDVWYTAPFVIALVGVPLLFPDGRLPSPRFRWVVWITVAGTALQVLAGLARLIRGSVDLDAIVSTLVVVSVLATVFGLVGAGVAIWTRFRRGDPVQRQQVKWLLADAGVVVVAFPPAMALGSSDTTLDVAFWLVGFLAFLGLPIAIGIAVLRYRLYEIDRIISRTIGYAVVTVTLAATFAGAILLFQSVLAPLTAGNTVAVAASTLIVAALFQPLRRRVQAIVDRWFNRARYDAERTVAAFAAQLRDEVDLVSLHADVVAMVTRTVVPATVALWLRQPEAGQQGL
jgi:hypothetical protein